MKLTRILDKGARVVRRAYRIVYVRVKPYCCDLQQKRNHGLFAIDIKSTMGFFAQLNWCLYIFAHCERYGLRTYLTLSGDNYVDSAMGTSWFDYFFENAQISEDDKKKIRNKKCVVSTIRQMNEIRIDRDYDQYLTLEYASYLIRKYMPIKDHIVKEVDEFRARHFGNRKILGVNYRGTDKISEAPAVSYEVCKGVITEYLQKHSEIEGLFVSSDEMGFIRYIVEEIKCVPTYYRDDSVRSMDGRAVHTSSDGNNYEKGRDALVNSLLLSKCDTLIRTSSFLSAWSSLFNPDLKVILLNEPWAGKLWFPECAIMREQDGNHKCRVYTLTKRC